MSITVLSEIAAWIKALMMTIADKKLGYSNQ